MSSDTEVRVAVIGCGPVGQRHAETVWNSADSRLVAVCDVESDRAQTVAQRLGAQPYLKFEDLLRNEELDVVTIATPNHLHVEPALRSLEAGCHVFCEKPMAENSAEARQMMDAADARQRRFGINYNRRFGFGYAQTRSLLEAGRIGTPRHFSLRVSDGFPRPHVARFPEVILSTLLTHHIDLLSWLHAVPQQVLALLGPNRQGLIEDATLLFAWEDGTQASLSGHYRRGQTRTVERLEISGTEGTLTVRDVTREVELSSTDPDATTVFRANHFLSGDGFYDTLSVHLERFLAAVKNQQEIPIDGSFGVSGLRVVEAALESHRQGRMIGI